MNQAELRQTFNTISRNFESANEAAQENIYSFTSHYIDPCLGSIKSCVSDYTAPCFPGRDDPVRRRRARSRGRIEFDFDFYGDWEEDEIRNAGAAAWGNDELDSLLAGRGQPQAQRPMSYGARARKSDPEADPNAIPKSSYLGFLERLPFRLGSRVLRYQPSSAGLQENPGGLRIRDVEAEPLLEGEEDQRETVAGNKGHARNRSDTDASHSTHTSRSARSDLIMSDGEEDAQPLDDEFATVMLSRRTTGLSDDQSGGRSVSGKRPGLSRISTRTFSNRSLHSDKMRRSSSKRSMAQIEPESIAKEDFLKPPSMTDLKREEERLEEEEEMEIMQKREAAVRLAVATGLSKAEIQSPVSAAITDSTPATPRRTPSIHNTQDLSAVSPREGDESAFGTEPFPEFHAQKTDIHPDQNPP